MKMNPLSSDIRSDDRNVIIPGVLAEQLAGWLRCFPVVGMEGLRKHLTRELENLIREQSHEE